MSPVIPKVVSMLLLGGISLLVGCLPIGIVKRMGWDSAEDFNSSKKAQESCQHICTLLLGIMIFRWL
jgi:hypothetical protein